MSLCHISDVIGFWLHFKSLVLEPTEAAVPFAVRKQPKQKPWWTRALKKEQHLKNLAWRTYCNSGTNGALTVFNRQRNRAALLARRLRRGYDEDLAERAESHPKCFYTHVQSKNCLKNQIPALKNADGDIVSESANKCQLLADTFVATFRHDEGMEPPPFYREAVSMNALSSVPENILTILTKLDHHKGLRSDDIHPRILRLLANFFDH